MYSRMPEGIRDLQVKKCRLYLHNLKDSCKLCGGKGYIISEKDNNLYNDCECISTYNKYKKYLMSNIPSNYFGIKFSSMKENFNKQCYDNYYSILKNIDEIINTAHILFYKEKRTDWGVSSAGIIIFKVLIDKNHECYFMTISELIDLFYSYNSEVKTELLEYISSVPNLIIDDFGDEYTKQLKDSEDFLTNKIIKFFETRKARNNFTVINSTKTIKDLKSKYCQEFNMMIDDVFLQFPISSNKRKKSANESFKQSNPELAEIFKDNSSIEVKPKSDKKPVVSTFKKRNKPKTFEDLDI